MSITSYAQNFEDVMLWRALGHIPNGFYIDVGAQHPVIDSVSKAFYEHGWRGMHVEATPVYATLVRADRPDELVLQVALSDKPGSLTFYEIPDTGLSTGDKSIAEKHQGQGFAVRETTVPCITLADVFAQAGQREIHWLKIDVEGMEPQVLAGWGDSAARPWILVVESTYPNSQIQTHAAWQAMVLDRGYREVHFDGLSRFYVVAERTDLAERFNAPPNIFDGFALASTVPYNAPIRELIKRTELQHKNELAREAKLHETLLLNKEEQLITTANKLVEAEAQALELARSNSEQASALQLQYAEREQALSQQLQAGQQELSRLAQERVLREKEHAEQTRQARQELESLLRSLAQREQLHSQQLLQLQQESVQAKERQTNAHAEHEQELQQQIKSVRSDLHRLEREQHTLVKELVQKHDKTFQELRQQHAGELSTAVSRERELVARLLQHQTQVQQAKDEHVKAVRELERNMARTLLQRDQELQQQAKVAKKEAQRLALAWADKEKTLARQAAQAVQQARDEKEDLLHAQAQREQAFTQLILDTREQLEKQAAGQARSHSEQVHALHSEYAEREQARTQQLYAEQLELRRLQQDWAHHESALNREIAALQNEAQALRHAQQLQLQQHGFELSAQQDEQHRLTQSHAALEAQLKAEILAQQETAMQLRQVLTEVQQTLETTQASLTWRLTAPLRQLASLISSRKNPGLAFPVTSDTQSIHALIAALEQPQLHVQQETVEPLISTPHVTTTMTTPTIATTLDELLACHGQHFVRCAYQTLLGREPDPEGLAYYLARLRTGYSKMRIVAQLRLSKEGKTHAAELPGLDAAVQRYQRGQHPLVGGLFRWLDGTEDDRPTERKLRAIENQLSLLSDESSRRLNQIETALAGLHQLVVHHTQSVVVALGGTPQPLQVSSVNSTAHPPEPDSKGIVHLDPIQTYIDEHAANFDGRAQEAVASLLKAVQRSLPGTGGASCAW